MPRQRTEYDTHNMHKPANTVILINCGRQTKRQEEQKQSNIHQGRRNKRTKYRYSKHDEENWMTPGTKDNGHSNRNVTWCNENGSFAAGEGYRLARFSIYCREWILTDCFPQRINMKILFGYVAIHGGPAVKTILAEKSYRGISRTIYCSRQRHRKTSIDTGTPHNRWWPAISVDGHSSAQSIVVAHADRLTASPIYCDTYDDVHY